MSTHKDLPSGSSQWARKVDATMAQIQEVEAVARRLCSDFGIDFANPGRGLNAGSVPSVHNPVQLKLPSLQDLDIRDAVDGDLLTFDGSRGVWIARRHNTIPMPKEFMPGDPASYYTPPPPVEPPVGEGIWSSPLVYTNYITNPSFESGVAGWTIANDFVNEDGQSTSDMVNVAAGISTTSGGRYGNTAMSVTLHNTPDAFQMNWVSFDNLPLLDSNTNFSISVGTADPALSVRAYGELYLMDASGTVLAGANTPTQVPVSPTNAPWQVMSLGGIDASNFPGAAHYKVLIRFGGNLETSLEGKTVLLDGFMRSVSYDYFDGDTTGGEFTSAWTGTPHASTSIQTTTKQINAPAIVTLGEPFTVMGRGFPAGAELDVSEGDWYSTNSIVTTDASGNFTTTLNVPVNTDPNVGPVAGPGYLTAEFTGPYQYAPVLNVTYQ